MPRNTCKSTWTPGVMFADFSDGRPLERPSSIDFSIRINKRWLQQEPRSITLIAHGLFPNVCQVALASWFLEELGNALWEAGYEPEEDRSADSNWTWGGATAEAQKEKNCSDDDNTPSHMWMHEPVVRPKDRSAVTSRKATPARLSC